MSLEERNQARRPRRPRREPIPKRDDGRGTSGEDGSKKSGDEANAFDAEAILGVAMDAIGKGKSGFAVEINSPGSLARYYYRSQDGRIIPLSERVREFRNAFAQTGNADLADYVLDYRLSYGTLRAPGRPRGGIGSEEMDIQKMTPPGKTTVQGLLEFMRTAKGDSVNEVQKLLLEAGYMDPDVYKKPALLQNGVYDIYTQQAWTTLLKDAVMAGDENVFDTLRRRQEAIDANGGLASWLGALEPEREPFVANLAPEEDITGTGDLVERNLVGRNVEGFSEGLVGGYHAKQTAAQRADYDADVTGGSVEDQPSIEGYATQQLKQTHGPEVGAYAGLGAFNQILQDLGLGG